MADLTPSETQAGSRCTLVQLRRVDEPRGSLCAAVVGEQVPFVIQRSYWVFDVPQRGERAHHAHRDQYEMLVAVSGRFTVHCDDGAVETTYTLDSPDMGLVLPPLVFHHLDGFSPGAVCLAFASGPYDADKYVSDYSQFRELVAAS